MNTIEIIGHHVAIQGGILQLSEEQAYARQHQLEKVPGSKNLYKLIGETQFIEGEVFGYDGEISLKFAKAVEIADDEGAKKDAKKDEKKGAKKDKEQSNGPDGGNANGQGDGSDEGGPQA